MSLFYNNKIIVFIFFSFFIFDKINGKEIIDTLSYSNFDYLNNNSKTYIKINNIIIEGNKRTKSDIILRELNFKENDSIPFSDFQSMIEEDRRKLINTDLFNEVEIKFLFIQENDVDIKVEVIETIYWSPNIVFELSDRNFNDWWVNFNHDLKRINYGLGFEHSNISGRSDGIFLLATFGFIKEYEFEYYNPYITKKQKGGIEFNFNLKDQNHLEYNTINHIPVFYKSKQSLNKTLSTYIEYSHRESFYNYHYFKLKYQNTKINDSTKILNENYISTKKNLNQFFTVSYEFNRDFRDIKNYPLKGFRLNVLIEKTGLGLFGDVNKLKARIYYSKYFELNKKFYYSFNLYSYLSSKNQPYYLFEDENNIRGYQIYLIQGHSNVMYRNTLKKELFNKIWNIEKYNLKKFKKFPFKIYGKIFFDSGYVWGYNNNNNNNNNNIKYTNKLIYSTGLGFDFVGVKNYSFSTEFSRNAENNYNFYINFEIDF